MRPNRILALLLCLALLLAGCSASAPAEGYYDSVSNSKNALAETWAPSATAPMESPEYGLSSGITEDSAPQKTSQKLIRTVSLEAQTQDYEALLPALEAKISALGGYIESRDAYNGNAYSGSLRNRYCSMTVRIPADKLGEFISHVNEQANVTNTSESVEDITLQYVDTAARITALETEQTRLLELLEESGSLSDLLQIESRLSEVRYELERYASQLRVYDNLVDYATVHLSINEVRKLTPVEEPNMWQRIGSGFGETMEDVGQWAEDLLVWFVVNLPWLLIWAAVGTGAFLCCRALLRRRKPRRVPKQTESTPPQQDGE